MSDLIRLDQKTEQWELDELIGKYVQEVNVDGGRAYLNITLPTPLKVTGAGRGIVGSIHLYLGDTGHLWIDNGYVVLADDE